MKNLAAVVILVACVAFPCFATCMNQKEFDSLEKAIVSSQGDDGRLENEILPLLNKAIEANPDDPRLIKHRLDISINLGLLKNAQKDTDRMISLTNSDSFRFLACALSESGGSGKKEDYIPCYRNVYRLHSANKKEIDFLHVLSSSMGEMPEAESIRIQYLKSITEQGLRNWHAKDLMPFNRENFLYRTR